MEENIRKQLADLLRQEVVLATGCTEPGAVALCVSKACETLGREPEHINILLSKNVFKNAMGVGIPGTGMIGLPIAVSLAVVAGDSRRGLEVLTLPPDKVEKGKAWLANNASRISIGVKEQCEKLYIECVCTAGSDTATAIISQRHTHFVLISRNGNVLCDASATSPNLETFTQDEPSAAMENAAGDIVHTVVARTVAASDARMDGCTLSVYSNSGSGNQGIACTLPVYNYGKAKGCTEEQLIRALILNHLMSIYIKRGIGRLSALCGIVNASIGVACGIVYLHGGTFEQMCYAIKNMINTIAGMVCDGAKPSCALKMSTGLYSAFVSAELAYHDCVVDATDGLSESDVDCSIRNLGRLGHDGMDQVDDTVLDIMTHKQ